jgi:hypothetical protein
MLKYLTHIADAARAVQQAKAVTNVPFSQLRMSLGLISLASPLKHVFVLKTTFFFLDPVKDVMMYLS